MSSTNKYFPGLNGLRFIAAVMVMIGHIEMVKSFADLPNFDSIPFIGQMGDSGVTLFFVLSGFLISFLLLQEKENKGKIEVFRFYMRRLIRIWPLYYLMIFLAFFVLPFILSLPGYANVRSGNYFSPALTENLFFLPNLAMVSFPAVPFCVHLWSIGVEEQFYFFWPLIIRFKKIKPPVLFVGVILLVIIVRKIFYILRDSPSAKHTNWEWLSRAAEFFSYFPIECMAIGGLGAWWLFRNLQGRKIIFHPAVEVGSYLVSLSIMSMKMENHLTLKHLLISIGFIIIILNLSSNPSAIVKLRGRVPDYLGKISYGVYIFHFTALGIAWHFLQSVQAPFWLINSSLYLLSFGITFLLAGCSYRYFESPILKWKERFR